MYLVMEFCGAGDLSQHIKANGPLKPDDAQHLLRQLCAGLQFMRSHNMIHRDLKPQNLLLSNDLPKARPTSSAAAAAPSAADSKQPAPIADDLTMTIPKPPFLKIADFGFARYMQPQSLAATLCGSPLYMVC